MMSFADSIVFQYRRVLGKFQRVMMTRHCSGVDDGLWWIKRGRLAEQEVATRCSELGLKQTI